MSHCSVAVRLVSDQRVVPQPRVIVAVAIPRQNPGVKQITGRRREAGIACVGVCLVLRVISEPRERSHRAAPAQHPFSRLPLPLQPLDDC